MWLSRLLCLGCLLVLTSWFLEVAEGEVDTYALHVHEAPWDKKQWLQKEIDFPAATTKVSICLHLYIHYIYQQHSTLLTLEPYAVVDIYKQKVFLTMGATAILGQMEVPVRRWLHLCVLLSNEPLIALDGTILNTTSRASHMESKELLLDGPHNLTVGVPGAGGQLFPPLGVRVTLPRVFPLQLSADQIKSLADCSALPAGEIGNGHWRVGTKSSSSGGGEDMNHGGSMDHGGTPSGGHALSHDLSMLDNQTLADDTVCPPHPKESFLVLEGTYSFQDGERWCASLGGRLPSTSSEDAFLTMDKVREEQGRDSIFVWFAQEGHHMCQMLWGAPDHPRMMMKMACEEVCLSTHLLCQVPEPLQVTLRYNEMEEDPFFIVPDGVHPRFLSVSGRRLGLTRDALRLFDNYGNLVSNASLPAHGFMGRHAWRALLDGSWSTMTLTTCGLDEFTCNIGTCIPLPQRCNGHDDCGDDSDETCNMLLPLPSSYRRSRPPELFTAVALSAEFVGYQSIDVNNNLVNVELKVVTTWQDHRVTVAQLSENHNDNILPDEELWYPAIVMPNSVFDDRMEILQHQGTHIAFTAKKTGTGLATARDGYEGYVYNTSENAVLVRSETSTAAYHCYFDLQLFPFDVHVCNVEVEILNSGSFSAYFDTSSINVTSQPTTMPLFQIYNVRYSLGDVEKNAIVTLVKFKILLERQCGGFIMSIMAPSLFITVIGAFTTSFREDNFSDRIMVTLSCLIVDAALISQSSAMIPESSYPKAFDIYFFYSASRLFAVFFFHLVFNFLRLRHEAAVERSRRPRPAPTLPFVPEPPSYVPPVQKTLQTDIYSDLKLPLKAWMAMDPSLQPSQEKPPSRRGSPSPLRWHKRFQLIYLVVSTMLDVAFGVSYFVWVTLGRSTVFTDFDDSLV